MEKWILLVENEVINKVISNSYFNFIESFVLNGGGQKWKFIFKRKKKVIYSDI